MHKNLENTYREQGLTLNTWMDNLLIYSNTESLNNYLKINQGINSEVILMIQYSGIHSLLLSSSMSKYSQGRPVISFPKGSIG